MCTHIVQQIKIEGKIHAVFWGLFKKSKHINKNPAGILGFPYVAACSNVFIQHRNKNRGRG